VGRRLEEIIIRRAGCEGRVSKFVVKLLRT